MQNSQSESKLLTLAVGVGIYVGGFGGYLVPIQIGAIVDGLGFSQSQTGLLGAVELAAMSITAILISPHLGRWPMGRVAMIGVVLAGLSEIFTGLASTLVLLFPLRLLTGVGCGLVFGSVCAVSASTNNPDRIFGLGQALMNVLFLITFLLLPYTLAFGMHRGLFFSLGILLLLITPLFRVLNRSTAGINAAATEGAQVNKPLIILHIIATILLNIGLGATWGFVERIGSQQVGLDPETIGRVLSAATLFMIGGSLLAAWLGGRIGRAIPMTIAAIISGLAAVTVAYSSVLLTYATGLFIYNLAYLFIGVYIIAGTASALDPSGRLASAMAGVMFLSYSVGIGMAGFIADLISLSGIGILALITCLIAAPLFAIVGQRLDKAEISAS